MDWPLPIIIIDAAIALIAFLVFRNRREKKAMESKHTNEYQQEDEMPAEKNYSEALK
jgi:FtsZ-interacting cell division protein ZipA